MNGCSVHRHGLLGVGRKTMFWLWGPAFQAARRLGTQETIQRGLDQPEPSGLSSESLQDDRGMGTQVLISK